MFLCEVEEVQITFIKYINAFIFVIFLVGGEGVGYKMEFAPKAISLNR